MTEEPEVYDALLVFPAEVLSRREGEPGEVLSRRSGGTGVAPGDWGHGDDEGNLEGAQEQQLAAGAGAEGAGAEGWQHEEGAAASSSPLRSLSRVVVSMNHTDVPPTQVGCVGTGGLGAAGGGPARGIGLRGSQRCVM